MARLASIEKAGYYPTPSTVTERILSFAKPPLVKGRLLDPCCGEGDAAFAVSTAWDLESYGIELDQLRSERARDYLDHVINADYEKVRAPIGSFNVLFLNPPYDWTGEGGRLELKFLRDSSKWLKYGGLLVYIIPQTQLDIRVARYLTIHFEDLRLFRFPDPDYGVFKQVVIFGLLQEKGRVNEEAAQNLVDQARLDEDGTNKLAVIEPVEQPVYQLHGASVSKFYFRSSKVDPKEALAEALRSGFWKNREWQSWFGGGDEARAVRPLMPLKTGHLAMLIACGFLQNLELDNGNDKHILVKGRTYKSTSITVDDETETIERDKFITEITELDLRTGQLRSLDSPEELSSFLEEWRDPITNKVVEKYRPLYEFDYHKDEVMTRQLASLSRDVHLPGREETGLFVAQKHVAAALAKRLQTERYSIIVGEMGVGKTKTAIATSYLMGARANPTIILCPPHLVGKWEREIKETIPNSMVSILRRMSDVDSFVDMVPNFLDSFRVFAIVSKEMAKLGSGWRGAYLVTSNKFFHKVYERDSRGYVTGKFKREYYSVFTCPKCGGVIKDEDSGLVSDSAWFEKIKRFHSCGEALFQYQNLGGQQNNLAGEVHLRYPIADYISRRYKGFFKLLVADEFHQLKAQDTDQGRAFGSLVKSADKTIAMTGTLYGGRSTSVFYLLHRLDYGVRQEFKWKDANAWATEYGIIERVTKHSQRTSETGRYSGRNRSRTIVREAPGVSPALAIRLLDSTAFVSLSDLGFQLPKYTEEPVLLDMDERQYEEYQEFASTLEAEAKKRLAMGDRSLLSKYLQSTLGYPNASWRAEEVLDKTGNLVAKAPALKSPVLFPKDKWLLDLCKAEKKRGRRVLVFCRQTATRDITKHLRDYLKLHDLRVDILTSSVGTDKREEWLAEKVDAGLDVLITNPKLVETGLDLVWFSTTAFYELDYSVYTMQQASRRTWRLGQTEDVQVHFSIYKDTMEHRAMGLIAKKWAAAMRLNGDSVEGALVQMDGGGQSLISELAKSVLEKSAIPDLQALFRDRAVSEKTENQFLGGYAIQPEKFTPDPKPVLRGRGKKRNGQLIML